MQKKNITKLYTWAMGKLPNAGSGPSLSARPPGCWLYIRDVLYIYDFMAKSAKPLVSFSFPSYIHMYFTIVVAQSGN